MTIGVNQRVSPIKFCFLIEPNSESNFERAVKIAFSYWGGIFSPILPLHIELSNEFREEYNIEHNVLNFYKNTIDNFDPDIILYDNSLDVEYIITLVGDRTLLTIEELLSNIEKSKIEYGIIIPEIISHIIETEFKFVRNDNLKLLLPKTQNPGLFLKSFISSFIDVFQEEINDQLKSHLYIEQPEITFDNISDHLPSSNIRILDINTAKIKSFPGRNSFNGEGIYFLNETRLNEIINYWNLRALGWRIIPIPLTQIDNIYFSELIERLVVA